MAPLNFPFFVFTTAGSPQRLFGQAVFGGPNCIIFAGCRVAVRVRRTRAVIRSRLRQPNWVRILVERARTRRVHRCRVLVVGRGRLRLRWNLRVRGRRLGAGRYRITLVPWTAGGTCLATERRC